MKEEFYDPSEHAREKQASRERDANDLVSGRVDARQMQLGNG